MLVEYGEVSLRVAEMQRVFAEEPFADRTLLRISDGMLGAVAERLAHPDCQHQSDLPSHMAGDGVVRRQYLLRDVGNGRHSGMLG